ncbi:MAG: hypothetical protein KFF50_02820 [Desulfatitalea sp.]|nr:hypothetical protein [Desulfatitalea sp.]
MLEIFVGLAVLWILKWLFPHQGAADKADSEIVPFLNHHDHLDGGGPWAATEDDMDSNWDTAFIDDMIDEDIDDEFIQ